MENINLYVIVGSVFAVVITIIWAVMKLKPRSVKTTDYSANRARQDYRKRGTNGGDNSKRQRDLDRKERDLRKREKQLSERERIIRNQERILAEKEVKLQEMLSEGTKRLSEISGISREDAKKRLFKNLEKELESEIREMKRELKENALQSANQEAIEIIGESLRKHNEEYSNELYFSVYILPSTQIKSWVIGSSGRNIRTFESATGAKLVISQFSDAVVISGKEQSQVKMAEVALEELINFGKITPELILDKVAHLKEEYVEFFDQN